MLLVDVAGLEADIEQFAFHGLFPLLSYINVRLGCRSLTNVFIFAAGRHQGWHQKRLKRGSNWAKLDEF